MPDFSSNLLHRWTFDSDLTNSVGSGNFTSSGGTPTFAAGVVGNAVTLPNATELAASSSICNVNASGSFTAAIWWKVSAAPGTTCNIFDKTNGYAGGNPGWSIYADADGDVLARIIDATNFCQLFSSALKLDENAGWVHLAITLDRGTNTFSLYVNGKLATSTPNLGVAASSIGDLTSAASVQINDNGVGAAWAGAQQADDALFYDRALSAEDIKALWISHIYSGAGSETLDFESDFGAVPDDTDATVMADNGYALQQVLACFELYDSMTVTFNDNFYVDMAYSTCSGAVSPTMTGTGRISWFGGDSGIEFFRATGTVTITIAEMTIWPLPFVEGTVATVAGDGSSFTVTLDQAFPTELRSDQIDWITLLDPDTLIPIADQLNWGETWFTTPALSGDRLTLTVNVDQLLPGHSAGIEPNIGDKIVVTIEKNGTSGFDYHQCENVTVTDHIAYCAARPAHMFRQCSGDLIVNNVKVIPEPGRLQSVGGTAFNFSANRGTLTMDGYVNQRAADDPLNMWTPYMAVSGVSGLQMTADPDPQICDVKVGDVFEFYAASVIGTSDPNDLIPLGTATVESVQDDGGTYWNNPKTFTLASGGHTPTNGERCVNLTARFTSWSVKGCDWNYIRSRGAILQLPNGVFEDFIIQNHLASAIMFFANVSEAASAGATEGHRASNVTVRNGVCYNCNFGTAIDWGGVITSFVGGDPSDTQRAGFYSNLKFHNIRIRGSVNYGLSLSSVDGIELIGIDAFDCASGIYETPSSTNVTTDHVVSPRRRSRTRERFSRMSA